MSIYFIRAGENGPVKIGCAFNPRVRLRYLQTGHYEKLFLIREMAGPSDLENRLHLFFRDRHIRGEWFAFDELMLTINAEDFPSSPRIGSAMMRGRWRQRAIELGGKFAPYRPDGEALRYKAAMNGEAT